MLYASPPTLRERRETRRRLEDATDLVRSDLAARRTVRRLIDAMDARDRSLLP